MSIDSSDRTLLRCVSLTGADDQTDLGALRELSARFPFVEWALLYVSPPGGPRNPTSAWRERFFDASLPTSSAVHLCFKRPFEELLAGTLPEQVRRANRLQLNINARGRDFDDAQVLEVFHRAMELGPSLILQYQPATAAVIEQFLAVVPADSKDRVHVLLDESRGTGKAPAAWRVPTAVDSAYCGFAGGLGPANMAAVLAELNTLERTYWVDMETGVRTDNRFDLQKVEQVLRAAASQRRS